MSTVRSGVEQAILVTVGAAALTRERAEAAVQELVKRGQLTGDEGRAAVEKLVSKARAEGGEGRGIVDRLEGGLQGALREVGVVTRGELEDIDLKLSEVDHRLRLIEERLDAGTSDEGAGGES
jgi:polyhydroxyalkanoate synthesis regulator phasin